MPNENGSLALAPGADQRCTSLGDMSVSFSILIRHPTTATVLATLDARRPTSSQASNYAVLLRLQFYDPSTIPISV